MQNLSKNYWRNTFGVTYIGLGALGFLLPTNSMPEIIARVVFIFLGFAMIISSFIDSRKMAVSLLTVGIIVLSFWLIFGTALILSDFHDPYKRIHLFYLGLWVAFAESHYRALRGLRSGE